MPWHICVANVIQSTISHENICFAALKHKPQAKNIQYKCRLWVLGWLFFDLCHDLTEREQGQFQGIFLL